MRAFRFLTVAAMFAAITHAAQTPPAPADIEAGVYYLTSGKWLSLPGEIVKWKASVVKHLAGAAIGKGGLHGQVRESGSPFHAAQPLELLVCKSENTGIEQYQLLRLHPHRDSREFSPGTGPASHGFGGTDKDQFTFASAQVGQRTYHITLSNLPIGEYGFLAPPVSTSTNPASTGRIYTFRVTATEEDGAAVLGWHLANKTTGLPESWPVCGAHS